MTTNYVFKDNQVIHFILMMLLINRNIDIDCSVRMNNFLINIFKVPTKSLFKKIILQPFFLHDMIKIPLLFHCFLIFQNDLDQEMQFPMLRKVCITFYYYLFK